jgi:hypothetical protein
LLGVEEVEQRIEVTLVRAAPVEEDEEALGLSGGWAYDVVERVHRDRAERTYVGTVECGSVPDRRPPLR